MTLLNLYHKRKSFANRLRGFLFQSIVLGKSYDGLKLSRNVDVWGKLNLGKKVFIGSDSKIYSDNKIGHDVYIGDNVELRCNGGNKITIGDNVNINRGTIIIGNVVIGKNCLIAPLCTIVGSNHNFSSLDKPINKQGISSKGVQIENNVWLGANVTVLDGVHIGESTIVGAGSVVTKNIPANSIAVGNPCKIIKMRAPSK